MSPLSYSQYIPSVIALFVEGDWLTDKDILCWLTEDLYHIILMNHVSGLLLLYEAIVQEDACIQKDSWSSQSLHMVNWLVKH